MKKILLLAALCLTAALPVTAQVFHETPVAVPFQHPWTGAKVGFIGDSISDKEYCYPEVKRYYEFLKEWLGLDIYVSARSGIQWSHLPEYLDKMDKSLNGQEPDAIMVFLGTNDYSVDLPIGEFYEETMDEVWAGLGYQKNLQKRRHRHLVFSDDTFKGRLNKYIKLLREDHPRAQIVLLTPIHRGLFDAGESNLQPDEGYVNRAGLYLEDYVEAIKEAANVWSVQVIDLHAKAALYPKLDVHAEYYANEKTDRLHPNTLGQEQMARTLFYQTSIIPVGIRKK